MTDSAVSPVTAASPVPAAVPAYRRKLYWVALLYFSEGLPLGVFFDIFPVYFRQQGVDLASIGLLSLLGLAWTLKFLWAPLVDWARRHRWWVAGANLGMAGVMAAFAYGHATALGLAPWVWVAIGAFTVLSATNDIATDGYTIELLDPREYGLANGLRIGFYRVGMLFAGAVLMLSGWVGWTGAYLLGGAVFVVNAGAVLLAPRERARTGSTGTLAAEWTLLRAQPLWLFALGLVVAGLFWPALAPLARAFGWQRIAAVGGLWWWQGALPVGLMFAGAALMVRAARGPAAHAMREGPVFGAWVELLARPGMIAILLFILLFKLGDAAMGFMVKPFWVDAGFSAQQIGLVSVNVGLALSIAGGLAGGWYVDRAGIYRGLWVLGLVAGAVEPGLRGGRVFRAEGRRGGGAVGRAAGGGVRGERAGELHRRARHRRLPRLPDGHHQPRAGDHRIRHPLQHLRLQPRGGGLGRRPRRADARLRAVLLSHLLAQLSGLPAAAAGTPNAGRARRALTLQTAARETSPGDPDRSPP